MCSHVLLKMNKLAGIAGWIGGRFIIALIVFQILGVGSPLNSSVAPVVRLLAVVAIPGAIEIVAVGVYLMDETSGL